MAPPEVMAVSRAPLRARSTAVDRVVVEVGPAPAPPGGEAGRRASRRPRRSPSRSRSRNGQARRTRAKRSSSVPLLGGRGGHDLLGQDVERLLGDDQAVELAPAHRVHQGRALDQLVAGEREEPPLGQAAEMVAGPPDALEQGGDRARRAELADQVHRADVDPQLQRGGGHQGRQLAGLEPALRLQPLLLGEAAVVGGDPVRPQALREMAGDPLGHAGGCWRRPASSGARGSARPAGRRPRPRPPWASRLRAASRRHLDRQVQPPAVPGVHDDAAGRAVRLHVRRSPPGSGPPPRSASGWPRGRSRVSRAPYSSSSRSRERERWEPRLSSATAWISSTITVRTVRSMPRPPSLVRRM